MFNFLFGSSSASSVFFYFLLNSFLKLAPFRYLGTINPRIVCQYSQWYQMKESWIWLAIISELALGKTQHVSSCLHQSENSVAISRYKELACCSKSAFPKHGFYRNMDQLSEFSETAMLAVELWKLKFIFLESNQWRETIWSNFRHLSAIASISCIPYILKRGISARTAPSN